MNVLSIRGKQTQVDIYEELRNFDWGSKAKWTPGKLIAPSPFRAENTPSFFVNLDGEYAGCFGDSGAHDNEWQSGNFVKLLAFLRNETYEETEEYLLYAYGFNDDISLIKLNNINLRIQRARQSLSEGTLATYTEDYTYLKTRGISVDIQRQMGVLFNPQQKAAVIPWRTPSGRLANVKFRSTSSKIFWYQRGGRPIRELVYGIEQAQAVTIICEAEIDAMSWMEAGYAAVAVGGASFNGWKRDIILRSPIEELIIATDNDKAGGKLRNEIETAMKGHVRVRQAYVCDGVLEEKLGGAKDANRALELYGVDSLRVAVEKAERCSGLYVNLRRKDCI
jgi:DNA primase